MVPERDLGGLDRFLYEHGGGRPKQITWFQISESRERDRLVAIGDEAFGFGEKAIAGGHVDQAVAGERRDTRKTHQINRDEGRRWTKAKFRERRRLEWDEKCRLSIGCRG